MKSRKHIIQVTLTFDKKITKAQAVSEFADTIHGEFYPGAYSDAETMKIGYVRSARMPK